MSERTIDRSEYNRRWTQEARERRGLSILMVETLELLAEHPRTFGELQDTNANTRQTIRALEERGLARCRSELHDRADSRWQITAAGRRELRALTK